MVYFRNLASAALLSVLCITPAISAENKVEPDPHELLQRMSQAHGGKDNWLAAPAVRLQLTMHLFSLKPTEERNWSDSWRHYDVVVDPDTSMAYVDLPHEKLDGYEAGFDGKKLWRTQYQFDPSFQDPAFLLSWYHYAMAALPFIANAEGATAEYLGASELPYHERPHHKVRVDYTSRDWPGEMVLYIDAENFRLRAWEQGTMFPPLPGEPIPDIMLPPASPLRVVDHYQEVGGFVLPRAYVSYNRAFDPTGFHFIPDAEILDKFERKNARPPEGAMVSFERE